MNQLGIITSVTAGREQPLKAYLSNLPRDTPPTGDGPGPPPTSPFTGALPPTHFARFVVIELDRPCLLFTAGFDGATADYLRALAATTAAQGIWSHCHLDKSGETPTAAELERYLCDRGNWRPAQYVVSAIPDGTTVAQINRALSLRAQLASLLTRAATLDPTALAHDFRQLAAIHALLRRP